MCKVYIRTSGKLRSAVTLASLVVFAAAGMAQVSGAVGGDETRCAGFKWDVSKEVTLFDQPGTTLSAGKEALSAPGMDTNRLYRLELLPQAQVSFAVSPGRNLASEGSFAGLVTLKVPTPGHYRVAVDAPLWIDVSEAGRLMPVLDFQGQQSCDGPEKIVEFDLSGGTQFVLQLSGAPRSGIRVTVTQTTPRKL